MMYSVLYDHTPSRDHCAPKRPVVSLYLRKCTLVDFMLVTVTAIKIAKAVCLRKQSRLLVRKCRAAGSSAPPKFTQTAISSQEHRTLSATIPLRCRASQKVNRDKYFQMYHR